MVKEKKLLPLLSHRKLVWSAGGRVTKESIEGWTRRLRDEWPGEWGNGETEKLKRERTSQEGLGRGGR